VEQFLEHQQKKGIEEKKMKGTMGHLVIMPPHALARFTLARLV
jgi:hypothetical protein